LKLTFVDGRKNSAEENELIRIFGGCFMCVLLYI